MYFGNFKVTHNRGRIIEENHYYAYGLRIQAISSKKLGEASEGHLQNQHLYNDKELIEDGDLGWYDYGFRNYDPQIGRFLQQDPLSDYYEALTPYHYAGGDPISNVDEDGLSLASTISAASSVVDPIKEVVGGLEAVVVTAKVVKHKSTFFSVAGGLFKGLGKSLMGTINTVVEVVKHPIRTAEGLVHVISHPVETAKAIGQVAKQTYLSYKNGNAEKRAEIIGEGIGELGQLFLGGSAVKVGTKIASVSRAAKATKVAQAVKAEGGAAKTAVIAVVEKEGSNGWLKFHEGVDRGHTLQRHVSKTDVELIGRLNSNSKISGASSFTNQEIAESVISAAIGANRSGLHAWLRSGSTRNLVLPYTGSEVIGRGIMRRQGVLSNLTNASVVLKSNGKGGYFILTAYPK